MATFRRHATLAWTDDVPRGSGTVGSTDASHYIQFDRPDVVIRAVRDVVARVRAGGAAAPRSR
jgi:hypothetical protein